MSEQVKMPPLGMNMEQGTFLNWVKQIGETIQQGEVIAEVEADKATIEVEAPLGGVLLQTSVNPGDTVNVGQVIAVVGAAGERAASAPTPAPAAAGSPSVGAPSTPSAPAVEEDADLPGGVRATPIARNIAAERGIDLKLVKGTGPNGRITKADVESYTPPQSAAPAPAVAVVTTTPRPAQSLVPPSGAGITEEPLSRMRVRIAQRTTESKQNVPHFYLTIEIDMAATVSLRKFINEELPDDHKVSVNDMIVKAAALALRRFPNLNSHFYGDKIIRYQNINVGIAVALDGGGLINVVAKNADSTPISQLAARNKVMIAGARVGKVKPEDLEGSTFTVSNLGPYGIEHFEAIINPPEAAILAVSAAKEVPVVINGEIRIGSRMKATLSVDHRVSDGAEGAQYLNALKELLENPMKLLL
ncbi:MAG TPA: dihydrolipoamide acetyltransferase family protein [Aggregatilineales bacterium]|nr:2-oxo acid dehydrogenase subunit E2 [Anaerolineales bacterium]HRE46209.1 dihydrolipoamide acetyltransferase family protein [Aggregatilineales bacterium]